MSARHGYNHDSSHDGCRVCEDIARRMRAKPFPVQLAPSSAPASVPWEVAEAAYRTIGSALSMSLEHIAQCGGFSAEALDLLCPGWRSDAK